ncbi:MAG: aminotransferase class IV, partial [Candidatus Omnitrophica bacterium]|nr:aminotransferase class IV [Candidatus Omnitrophota bacterium]
FFAPDGKAVFNVAIRTALIDNRTKKGEMGIGSGIVIDSGIGKEFKECELKADFITKETKDFGLVETILWKSGKGYFLLAEHLKRLRSSAEYFNFRFDKKTISLSLKRAEKKFEKESDYRVRLVMDSRGRTEISFLKLTACTERARLRFSDKKVLSGDIFLYHKTTNRDLYDKEHKKWAGKGYADVIFTNEKNQVTEGAISNIIIKKKGNYYTPPVECGLLDGVFRGSLFSGRKITIKEKVLYKDDVRKADEIYIVNSVRGMRKAVL